MWKHATQIGLPYNQIPSVHEGQKCPERCLAHPFWIQSDYFMRTSRWEELAEGCKNIAVGKVSRLANNDCTVANESLIPLLIQLFK